MAEKKRQKRAQVPVLDDAEPLHRQLDEYYLQRERDNIYEAPLQWQSEDPAPAYRPRLTPDEVGDAFDDAFKRTADHELIKNSSRGSKPFKASELRRGYRKV